MITEAFAGWRTPSLLWPLALKDPHLERLQQPVLLRFDSDQFMPLFLKDLGAPQPDIAPLVAHHETKKKQGAGWVDLTEAIREPLTLYQMTQGRYYMAAAGLVTRTMGLPQRLANQDAKEKAAFLLRRLVPVDHRHGLLPRDPSTYQEYGWVINRQGFSWQPAPPEQVLPDEERLPVFELPYTDQQQPRRFFAGMVPAGNRELYLSHGLTAPEVSADWDPRLQAFQEQIIKPLSWLYEAADSAESEESGRISTMLLLDLVTFLEQHLPGDWQRIPFRPAWAANLHTVWEHRTEILAGAPGAPVFPLEGVLVPEDLTHLTQCVRDLLKGNHPSGHRRRTDELFVLRFVLERPQIQDQPALLSAPSMPFELASFSQSGAPERPPQPGLDPGSLKMLTTLAKLLMPNLPKPLRKFKLVKAPRLRKQGDKQGG